MKKAINLALAASALAFSMGTQAATVSSNFNVGPLTTELTSATANGVLNQFDSSLGTLNSATLRLDYSASSSTSLLNTAAQGQVFSFSSGLSWFFELLGSGNTVLGNTLNLFNTGLTSLASGASLPLTSGLVSNFTIVTLSGADLNAFIGTGTTSIGCNTLTSTTFAGGGGNISNPQQTTASCGALVTYDYTAQSTGNVPEPAVLGLMGLGFAAMGAVRRRRQA